MFSSLGGGGGSGKATLLEGLEAPLPFPGFYETFMRTTNDVLWPRTFGRSAVIVIGNPVNASFGTQLELKLDGNALPQQAVAQQMAQGKLPSRRTRHVRFGGFYRSPTMVGDSNTVPSSTFQALLDQSGVVHARAAKSFSERAQAVLTASASHKLTPANSFSGRVAVRGDTWSTTVRARSLFHGTSMYGMAGMSAMKSLTPRLSVGGELYADGGRYALNMPQWLQWSASAVWKQSDWMAAATLATIPVRNTESALFLTYARKLGATSAVASQLLVRSSDHWSRVKIGASVAMPHSQSKMRVSFDTQGTMQTVWERRLLSTVRLQVTGELNLWSFKESSPQSPAFYGNRFGCCLQIGSVPATVMSDSPLLRISGFERDIPLQR